MTILSVRRAAALFVFSLLIAGCGSSGGTDNPPPPPAPVAPPPPPPEPTFEERLSDLAAFDPNPCRAETPGFEALGGWLKNDGRKLGQSRVWVGDQGALTDAESHGAQVWAVFTDCAVRSTEDQYAPSVPSDEGDFVVGTAIDKAQADGRDLIISTSLAPPYQDVPLPEPTDAARDIFDRNWAYWNGDREDGQRLLEIAGAGNDDGNRTGYLQNPLFPVALERHETALRIIVGGYTGAGEDRAPAAGSSVCGAADPLCLFAPWRFEFENDDGSRRILNGTSIATPQVSAALDTVWTVWPDMDILDLRNLAFDCAENMAAREGDTFTERTYSYSNGREFTSTTNSTWGHGILSLTCLFTPNGGLQDPTTGNPISGGIYGPVAGPITGAAITGVDYTGRDFGHGFARPVARENFALAATANLRPVQAVSVMPGFRHNRAAVHGSLWRSGALSVNLTAAGNAIGMTTEWQAGNFTVRSGIAAQPEGVGSLTGSRAFRAPSTVSAAIIAAYGRALPHGFSMHLQADHWQTLATQGRSLWQSAELTESRVGASVVKRAGPHEFSIQAIWQSGLSGSLDVDGRVWPVAGVRERGVWLTWRSGP